jgi:hypothetical protein
MTLIIADIPDGHADRLAWLERQLVSPDLPLVAGELAGIFGPAEPPARTLEEVWGEHLAGLLEHGLRDVPESVLRRALRNPALLLDLRERLFEGTSLYWAKQFASRSDYLALPKPWEQRPIPPVPLVSRPGGSTSTGRAVPPTATRSGRRWLIVAVAAVAFGFMLPPLLHLGRQPVKPVDGPIDLAITGGSFGWSGQKLMSLPKEADRKAHLQALAKLSVEYFDQPMESREELRRAVVEFRESCDRLIAYQHPQLGAATREWLVSRCKVWAAALDGKIAAIDADPRKFSSVRLEIDNFMNDIGNAIRAESLRPTNQDS